MTLDEVCTMTLDQICDSPYIDVNAIADAVLSRAASHVEDTADPHSLCYVILAMSHADTATHPGKLTVFKTTGDEYVQKTISAQAGAEPITGLQ